jgi:hypothetical protein
MGAIPAMPSSGGGWKPWQVLVGWIRRQPWVPAWLRRIGQVGAGVGAWPDQKPGPGFSDPTLPPKP